MSSVTCDKGIKKAGCPQLMVGGAGHRNGLNFCFWIARESSPAAMLGTRDGDVAFGGAMESASDGRAADDVRLAYYDRLAARPPTPH